MLYVRMLFVMGVNLFTVRIVLRTLGVENFGIYNVVSGVVSMGSFLSTAMATATQRFLAFELERKNETRFAQIFSMSLMIYLCIACLFLVLGETIGLWFVNTQLTIPPERIVAARWAFQFSIGTIIVSMLAIPYLAAILAYERMTIYAHIGVVEGLSKLVIVYMLLWVDSDKLKLYSVLVFLVSLGISFIPYGYCRRQFKGCRYFFYWERKIFQTLVTYSSWNLWGNLATVVKYQGLNILLNIFFGPVVNASRAVAFQVSNVINNFVSNFSIAVYPQIIKKYSSGNLNGMLRLVFYSARYGYYLVMILSMPILLRTEFILTSWLKNPPDRVVIFTQLVIINALIDALSFPLMAVAQATGRIKAYQTVVGGISMFNLPISYVFLKSGFPPEATFYVSIVISCVCLWLRLFLIRRLISLKISDFLKEVLRTVSFVTVLAYLLPGAVLLFAGMDGIADFVLISVGSLISSIVVIYFVGMNAEERDFVKVMIQTKLLRKKRQVPT